MKLSQGLVILGVVAIGTGALFWGAYSAASAPLPDGFPSPTTDGVIEVKQYPPYRAATVQVVGPLADAPARGFSPLFRHISSNDISMTAPVETRYPTETLQANAGVEGEAAVSFLYRNLEIVPEEIAQTVQVEDMPAMTVVSLGVRGGYQFQTYLDGVQQLQDWLTDHPGYAVVGSPRRFFYDGPYLPNFLKRSDIQIPVQVVSASPGGQKSVETPVSLELGDYLWQNRLLLVFAPTADTPAYQQQRLALATAAAGFADRDLLLIELLTIGNSRLQGAVIEPQDAEAIRTRYGVAPEAFKVILVGKDGIQKRQDTVPVAAEAIFSEIDAMPMRRREMQQQGES